MGDYSDIQIALLRKMFHDCVIGARHQGEREICRGFPPNLKSGVKNELKRLRKEGLVRIKKASYGDQYSLEPTAIPRIKEILEKAENPENGETSK